MIESEQTIAYCHACGLAMDVSPVAPFSNVECPSCGKHTRVKREFGPYTLTKRHAIGGMSMVFSAHDNTLNREVAVKILSEEYSSDERRIEAFEQEARLTAGLSHPNIVKVYTTGRAFGRFYIAMEFVPGGHFEHQIRERGKLPEAEVLQMAIEVAHGLKAAQAAGLIHRDVKPGNILLDADGHAKLVDFGLALVTQGGTATATELWATPYYVPPETVEGLAEDFRSDMYAYGATLYHALAGVPPCNEESMASDVLREAKKRVIPLAQADATISAATCRIVDRAMAYSPNDRFSSYDEMIAALQQALSHLKHGRSELNTAARRALKKRRERQWIIGSSAVAVGVAACVVLALWLRSQNQRSKPPQVPAGQAKPAALMPSTTASNQPHHGKVEEVARRYRQAREALQARDYQTANGLFSALLRDVAVQEPTRSWTGVEAVLTAFLDGNTSMARQQAKSTLDHLRSLSITPQPLSKSLVATLEQLEALPPPSAASEGSDQTDATRLAALMLASLKAWEQGLLDRAVVGFRSAAEITLPPEQDWASCYQDIAKDYLADATRLQAACFEGLPSSAPECQKVIDELNLVQAALKTRGRARFNVRSWQQELTAHRNRLVRTPDAAATTKRLSLDEVTHQLRECARAGRHREAQQFLASAATSVPDSTRKALLAFTESAASFFSDLESELTRAAVSAEFSLRNGVNVTSVRVDAAAGLSVTTSDGKTTPVSWEDFYPDAPILLHQKLLAISPVSNEQQLQRNEGAIAHLWLSGERERANNAASKLGSSNPEFATRWSLLKPNLPP